jgi:hypothetical protein
MYIHHTSKMFKNTLKIFQKQPHSIFKPLHICKKNVLEHVKKQLMLQYLYSKNLQKRLEFQDTNKQIVQASTVQNQFVKTTIDTAVQNIQAYSENVNAFADLNKNIVQSWTTPFTLKN